jgi:heptaprenyl diphosphate synthase
MGILNKLEIERMAMLAACASVLQICESLIPHPLPGIRLGLANIITLIALTRLDFRAAMEIALFRTLISALILGTFLSPGFLLSFSGAICSTLVMAGIFHLSNSRQKPVFSLVGLSLFGSVTHNLVQLGLVYLLFIRHPGLFWMLPWLGISAVIMGWLTGLTAIQVSWRLESVDLNNADAFRWIEADRHTGQEHHVPVSPVSRMRPELKIFCLFGFAILFILIPDLKFYVFFSLFCSAALILARVSWKRWFRKLKKLSPIFLFAFLLPVVLTRQGQPILQIGRIELTQSGLSQGTLFMFRLILLFTVTSLLTWTTSRDHMIQGMAWLLKPLRIIGLDQVRSAAILAIAMSRTPVLFETTQTWIRNQIRTERRIHRIIPELSNFISSLYTTVEKSNTTGGNE